jgi:hypothetical protein
MPTRRMSGKLHPGMMNDRDKLHPVLPDYQPIHVYEPAFVFKDSVPKLNIEDRTGLAFVPNGYKTRVSRRKFPHWVHP